jgi:hypothetical protein
MLAEACNFDAVVAGRLALVVTELGSNLVRHASGGRLWLSARPARQEVEVLAIDRGPGIANVEESLGDGFPPAARRAPAWAPCAGWPSTSTCTAAPTGPSWWLVSVWAVRAPRPWLPASAPCRWRPRANGSAAMAGPSPCRVTVPP